MNQKSVADLLCMDVSNYSRRESGVKHISHDEWIKLASIFEVEIQDIYENENESTSEKMTPLRSGDNIIMVPKYLLEVQRKYILKLEDEIQKLKSI